MTAAAIITIIILALILVPLFAFEITGLTGAPYVPSQQQDINKALTQLYKLSKNDLLIDLGSGNGVVLQAATASGAKAIGVELNPFMVLATRRRLRGNHLARVKCGNMYRLHFPPETTVVYAYANMFTIPKIYRKVQQEAERLGKPLYLISNAFDLPGVKPVRHLAPYYLYKIT